MISSNEMVTFIREIYLLINEYNRCTDNEIKEYIMLEITTLSDIIKN